MLSGAPVQEGAVPDGSASDLLEERELRSEVVFRGSMLEVRRDHVRLPDGGEATREYIRHPGAVVIVAEKNDGSLVLERQFRYPLRRSLIELPAGKMDPGEDSLECARRELREETGYVASSWQHLGVTHPCVGYSDEGIEIFLARELAQVGHAPDEGEFLEIVYMPMVEAIAAVHDGRITDGKTIVALFRALPFLDGRARP